MFPRGGPLWVPPWGATIFLGAQGGPVTWSATVSQGNGSVTVSPSGGTLAEGGRGTVTITASQSADGQQVTLYPGGTVYTIMVYRGHHPSPHLRAGYPGTRAQRAQAARRVACSAWSRSARTACAGSSAS